MKKTLGTLLFISFLSITPASFADSALSKSDVESIVKDVIKNNPEIIKGALIEERKKEEAEVISKRTSTINSNRKALFNNVLDYRLGNPKSDVKIVVMHDLRCAHCKAAHKNVQDFLAEEKNVDVIYKDYPIMGPESKFAARATLAARKQDQEKQNQMVLKIMSAPEAVSEDEIVKIATDCKLDVEKLKKDMLDDEILKCMGETKGVAKQLGIFSTPTFIIGKEGKEKVYEGALEKDELKDIIAEARKA